MFAAFYRFASPLHRSTGMFGRAVRRYVRSLVLWRTRHALLQLNDHMLRDIGLRREDIELGLFVSLMDKDREM
jgi:uncharacterized protein YjiS (DUF1127 family)